MGGRDEISSGCPRGAAIEGREGDEMDGKRQGVLQRVRSVSEWDGEGLRPRDTPKH